MIRKSRGKSGVIRVSPEVLKVMSRKRTTAEFRSWDAFFRTIFGIAPLKGELPHLREFWIVDGLAPKFPHESQARGEAVRVAALTGKAIPKVIHMREVI